MCKVLSIPESAVSQIQCDVADFTIIVHWESKILSDIEEEFRSKIMVDLIVIIGEFLSICKFHIRVGSLLSPRVTKVNKMPSDMLSIVSNILNLIPVAGTKELINN